ncbi:hypothetical protein IGL98_003263 [Enterococcus sp. DIV0840]|uniref:hypothetical protein n=1 Tax=unclassified Enterococcus TaxID=2608891 RepID=UPI0030D54567
MKNIRQTRNKSIMAIVALLFTVLAFYAIKAPTKIKADEETRVSSTSAETQDSAIHALTTETERKKTEVETSETVNSAEVPKDTSIKSNDASQFSFYTANVDSDQPFGATAIPQVIRVGETFTKKPEELLKNILLPEGHTASYSYVGGQLPYIDTTGPNSLILKINMVDNNEPENKLVIKVPLAILETNQSLNSYIIAQEPDHIIRIDYADYSAKVSNTKEMNEYILEKSGLVVFNGQTGKSGKMTAGYQPGILPSENPTMGVTYELNYYYSSSGPNIYGNVKISFRNEVNPIEEKIEKEFSSGYTDIPYGSKSALLTNNQNGSKIGMIHRGIHFNLANPQGGEIGYNSRDKNGRSMFELYGVTAYFPYIDGKKQTEITKIYNSEFANVRFLKKDNRLRQIVIDQNKQVVYVLDAYIEKNGSFIEEASIYNTSANKRTLGLVSANEMDYLTYGSTTYLYSNSSGFYMLENNTGKDRKRFYMKVKNSRGQFLGDQSMWVVGKRGQGDLNLTPPKFGDMLKRYNFFYDDFSRSGFENKFYANGTKVMAWSILPSVDENQQYQVGVKHRPIESGEKLRYKVEYGLGEVPPYILIDTDPKEYNVYSDYDKDSDFSYELSQIPEVGNTGTVTFTFPDETTKQVSYKADKDKKSKGDFTVPRKTLPNVLNDSPGTIKSYYTDIFAENDSLGITSEENTAAINVYRVGAKPIPQIIQKGKPFTKKPQEIIRDPIILPGNTAVYEYEGELPDTSTLGLKSVLVRMTDKERPDETALIKVPVQVVEGPPPTSGLFLAANDYSSPVQELQGITEDQVNELILKNSEAIAWDVGTGSTEDIQMSVTDTTLKPNAQVGTYKASIKAVKGTLTAKKDITINIIDKQTVKVEFLDEAGEPMHEPVSLLRTVGTKIDLTKEEEVQAAINEIQKERYQIYERPENETALVVPNQDTTVTYRFEGTLFVSSYPNYMNFGVKILQASTPFIRVEKARYDRPLKIWDNRKGTKPWTLMATLEKPLTSQEDESKNLPEAIRYKKNNSTTVVLRTGTAETIETKKIKEPGDVNISEEWDSGKSGLQLEVPVGKVVQVGKYQATILWQLAETP